jgi:hypothetical protein
VVEGAERAALDEWLAARGGEGRGARPELRSHTRG